MSKKGGVSYTENDSVKESWKNSVFKDLFGNRKKLFDSYPAVHKGLALSDPTIKFGKANYTFKTSDVVDKATFKEGNREFQARYKKDAKKFDVSVKEQITPGYTALLKYENRGDGVPHYVAGVDFDQFGVLGNAKFNPFTGLFKCSAMYNLDKVVEGAKVAGDLKTVFPVKNPAFNIGCIYKNPAGTTGLAFNNRGHLTINHHIAIDKNLSAAAEFVQPLKDDQPANNLQVAVGYKIDKEHEIRARANKKGEINVAIKKDFSKQFSVQLGTVFDGTKPDSLFRAPAFGFKLKADM